MTAAENAVALFSEYARQTGEGKPAFILAHPALLANAAPEAIRATLSAGETSPALDELVSFRAQLDAGRPYPLGVSPIEAAWQALLHGEISLDEALRRARTSDVVNPLAYPYVRPLSAYVLSLLGQKPRDALSLQTLLLAATEAAEENPEALLARTQVSMNFITAATPALIDVPDGRLYRRASEAGAWLATRPERLTLWPPGELEFRLGVLNLDPYFLGGDVANYERSFNAWKNRLLAQLGPAAASIPPDDLAMPAPAEALAKAVAYLNEAVAKQTGDALPNAQKALAQALALQAALGFASSSASGNAAAPPAVQAPAGGDPVLTLMALSGAIDKRTIETAAAEREILALPAPEELLRRAGPEHAVQAVLDSLLLLLRLNSVHGLAFVETYRGLVAAYGSPDARIQFWDREVALFVTDASATGADSPAALVRMVEPAQRESREGEVIAALDRLVAADPGFASAHADALQYLRYLLIAGLASNAIAAGRWSDAIENDGLALSYCLRYGFTGEALSYATRIDDLASREGSGVDAAVTVVVLACALRFEAALGEPALRLVRSMCTKAVTGMLRAGSINARIYGSLMLAATGTRLGASLRAGVQVRPGDDEQAHALLARIAEIERTTGPVLQELDGEEILLASFVEADEREDGAQPEQRLRNVQRAFDARIEGLLAASAADRRPEPFTLEELRAVLDERTVLLHYFLGASPDGRIATTVMLVTKEDLAATAVVEQFPAGLVRADLGSGLKALMPPLAFVIQERRSQVRAEPGPRLVDRAAGEGLASDLRRFLGPLVERLSELRAAGKTHLTIVPHGPLHFYPWPLLGGPDGPIANDWTIDVAPSLGFLLARSTGASLPPKTERAVIGLSFAKPNRLGLPPIPASTTEATAVAATLGVAPILDDSANKATVLAALGRARYAHISTHGRHAVVAPGFQSIFCADDGAGDAGRLCAYEILARDLRGLELLTLSACETALGRYDLGDNLRGLPAAFFLAGVQTIVATLWPVSSSAAAAFFPAFYAAVESGASQRDAFAAAQTKTRAACPKFRDWGAFYLMGRAT